MTYPYIAPWRALQGSSQRTLSSSLKGFIKKSSKQSASFSRSLVANKALQDAQLKEEETHGSAHKLHNLSLLTTKTMNQTRWRGLWEMANRNRRLGPEIRKALTGDISGICTEDAAEPSRPIRLREADDESSDDPGTSDSEGNDQDVCALNSVAHMRRAHVLQILFPPPLHLCLQEANLAAGKTFPLAHRCLSMSEFRDCEILESLLDRAREVTLESQKEEAGFGEGLDLGASHMCSLG